MKKNILFVIVLLSHFLFSQQSQLTGKIVNGKNNPLQSVEILLLTQDSIAVRSELSDTKGLFAMQVNNGSYILQVKQLKDIVYSKNINLQNNTNLGNIEIDNTEEIREVIIKENKKLITRKVDRLIFNVENSISATGGDALDVLKITPSLRIQNDKISMIGKSGMAVMIDDKLIQLSGEDLVNYLKTISSDNVKSIEVITTPPAKYDAEGNSGLVNIILKRTKIDSWNASVNSSYKQASYATGVVGGNFNYQKNKFTIYSSLNYIKGSNAPVETTNIYYPTGTWFTVDKRHDYQSSFNGRASVDYNLTKKWKIGIQYLRSNNKPGIDENILTSIYNKTHSEKDSLIQTLSNNNIVNSSQSINLNSVLAIDSTGRKMTLNFDYFKFKNEQNRNFNTINILSANNESLQNIKNYSGKIDFEHPLSWLNLSYGAKVSFISTNSNINYYNSISGIPIFDPTQSNQFRYKENTQSIYVNGTKKIEDKWEAQLGLRLENTQTEGVSVTLNQINKNNYTKIFPSIYLVFTPNEKNSFSINYSKRISRPFYNSLNPFRWYQSPYSYSEGNPFLQPYFSHNLEFSFVHLQQWENKIYFSKENNNFGQLTTINANSNIESVVYQNFYNKNTIGLTESYTFSKYKWWESINTADISYTKAVSKVGTTNPVREGTNSYFSTVNTFTINKSRTIAINLNFWISLAGVSELDKSTSAHQIDMGVKFLLLQKKLQLTLAINDILSSNRPIYTSTSNNINVAYRNYYDNRFYRLSFVYKFGNNKLSTKKYDLGNEDERKRID